MRWYVTFKYTGRGVIISNLCFEQFDMLLSQKKGKHSWGQGRGEREKERRLGRCMGGILNRRARITNCRAVRGGPNGSRTG